MQMPRLRFEASAALLMSGVLASWSAFGGTVVAQPHPRQSVTVLAVNSGQEVLVDLGNQGRAVRLACLQAPLAQQQPWARLATEQLQHVLPVGREVILELRARDVYGRLVGRLLLDNSDVVLPLLSQGAVFAYDGYLGRCDDLPYATLEAQAQKASLGIWGFKGGLERPWDLIEASGGGLAP